MTDKQKRSLFQLVLSIIVGAIFLAGIVSRTWFLPAVMSSLIVALVILTILRGADYPRATFAGLLVLFGLLFLSAFTPIFSPYFAPEPTTASISNRLVFAVNWLPLNGEPQTTSVLFDTVRNQLFVTFHPTGIPDGSHQNTTGILYITEPFNITGVGYPSNLLENSKFGNWTFGPRSQVFGEASWYIRLDYNFSISSFPKGFPCYNNGETCQMLFNTEPMTRTDFNGGVSMEIQYKSLNGGYGNLCQSPPCMVTNRNMSTLVTIAIPHDSSSLQASPSVNTSDFNQAFTNLEWDNLTSPIFLTYISPQKLAQNQFLILTSGILISSGVAMWTDGAAKWFKRRRKRVGKTKIPTGSSPDWGGNESK